jgi:hypothetical protein
MPINDMSGLMLLNEFSTLIQLSATINIAFVAVEYAKSYSHILAKQVFKFDDHISESFQKCKSLLVDKNTLDAMKPVDINGKSTSNKIEETKRQIEQVESKLKTESTKLVECVHEMCKAKCLSSLSLNFFLLSIVALFLCGLKSYSENMYYTIYWLTLSMLNMVYVIFGYIFGEKENQYKYLNFTILRHCIVFFFLSMIVTALLMVIFWSALQGLSKITLNTFLIVTVISPWINFICYFIFTKRKSGRIREIIESTSNEMKNKCQDIKNNIDNLLAVSRLDGQLIAEESDKPMRAMSENLQN